MNNSTARALGCTLLALTAFAACRSGQTAAGPAPAPETAPREISRYATGDDAVAAMRERYRGKWYRTLTFRQKTSQLRPNGTWSVQTWYEAMHSPGRLRIDFDPISAGNGVLYARDSQFVIQNGRVTRSDPGINDLLLLGFDVYHNEPARTAALMRGKGFDLARLHMDSYEGRSQIVIGALAGDTRRKQLWVDAERLTFTRLLEPARDTSRTRDIRFMNYAPQGGGWIAPRVEIYEDGRLVFYEEYLDVRTDITLDDALFEPRKWRTVKHWTRP